MSVQDAGRRGGIQTRDTYGREHYVRIGKLGGLTSPTKTNRKQDREKGTQVMTQQQNPNDLFSTPLGSRAIQDQPTPDGQREGKLADVAPVQSNIANTANTTPGMDENSTPWIQRHPLDELPAPLQVGWSPTIPMPPQATTVPLLKPAYQVLPIDMTPADPKAGQGPSLRDGPPDPGYANLQPDYQTIDESNGERL